MAALLFARINIGIAHLRNEIVVHGDLQVGILLDGLLVVAGMTVHELVFQGERRELMAASHGSLPLVGQLAGDDVHLVVFRTVDDVGRALQHGCGGVVETVRYLDAPVFGAPDAVLEEGGDDARELDGGIGTILIAVHVGTGTAGLPLVGAMKVHVDLLCTAKSIAPGEADLELWAHAPDGAIGEVGLNIEV